MINATPVFRVSSEIHARLKMVGFVLLRLALLATIASPICAEESADDVGREALQSLGNVPWYDSDNDGLRAMEVDSTDGAASDSKNRGGGTVAKEKSKAAAPPANNTFWNDLGSAMGWVFLGLLLLAVCAVLFYAIATQEQRRARSISDESEEEHAETEERLERLPVQVRQPTSNLLAEAKRLMEEGKYNEAIVYLFSHELVQLDRHQFLRLARGKTNRQYLREVRSSHELRNILHGTIHIFEEAFFGNHPISRERFLDCWDRLSDFHAALTTAKTEGAAV